MSKDEILDQDSEQSVKHEIYLSKNKAILSGAFAWAFYANLIVWFISGLIHIVKDVYTLFN